MTEHAPITSARAEHVFHVPGADVRGRPLPSNQIDFEAAVLNDIVQANPQVRYQFAAQLAVSHVVERFGSGAGCRVYFSVPIDAPRLPTETPFPLGSEGYLMRGVGGPMHELNATIHVPDAHSDSGICGAILLHYDGYISYLDCHSYGEAGWPEDKYEVWFISEGICIPE
jgi:hypothetical protein